MQGCCPRYSAERLEATIPEIYEQLKNWSPPSGVGPPRHGTTGLVPGKDLDELVAVRVMGWHLQEHGGHWLTTPGDITGWRAPGGDWCHECSIWTPSTDVTMLSGWAIIRRMTEGNTNMIMIQRLVDKEGWACRVWDQYVEAQTSGMAVCVAALMAVGLDEA